MQRLASEPENAARLLAQWDAMTTEGVIAEVGPPATGAVTWLPGYSAAILVTKISQGRSVTGLDMAFAAIDGVEAVLMVRGGGATLKALATGTRNAMAKRIGTEAAKKVVPEAAEEMGKKGLRSLAPWLLEAGQQADDRGRARKASR